MSPVEKYKQRHPDLESLTLFKFLLYDFARIDRIRPRPRAKARVLNYFPRYQPTDEENYARVKLMLHCPFRQIEVLKYPDDLPHDTFKEAWNYWRDAHPHSIEPDFLEKELPEEE